MEQEEGKTGQEQAEQAQAPTAENVQQGIAALDATVQEHGLNDPASAKGFADEFCSALGTDVYRAGVDVQALGSTVAKTALSAMQVYEAAQGNIESLPPIPAESARAFSYDLLKGFGIDPRTVDVDEQLLSQTVLGGVLNFYDTFQKYGGSITDLSKLNDPQAAEMFLGNFMRALGSEQPVNRQTAIKVADALGSYLLGFIGKINAANQRQAESRQGQSNSGRGRGQRVPARFRDAIKGSKAPRFTSNQDIFSGSGFESALRQNL
jgi:predicted component of type VI protein secretion system